MILNPKTSHDHLIHNFIDNELTGQELDAFQTRIQTDQDLAKQVADFQKVKNILSNLPMVTVPRDFRLKPELVEVRPPQQLLSLFFQRSFFLFAFIFLTLVATDGIVQTTISQPVPMAVSAELSAPVAEPMPMALEAPMAVAPMEEPLAGAMNKVAVPETMPDSAARSIVVPDAIQDSEASVNPQSLSFLGLILKNRQAIFFGIAILSLASLLLAQISRKKMEMNWRNKYIDKDVR